MVMADRGGERKKEIVREKARKRDRRERGEIERSRLNFEQGASE